MKMMTIKMIGSEAVLMDGDRIVERSGLSVFVYAWGKEYRRWIIKMIQKHELERVYGQAQCLFINFSPDYYYLKDDGLYRVTPEFFPQHHHDKQIVNLVEVA